MRKAFFALPLALVAACTDDTIIQEGREVASITVTGEGMVSARPDLALLTFSVRERAETAGAAFSAASGRMNAVLAALEEEGLEERDLQTRAISLSPVYAQNERGYQDRQRIVGYEAYQALAVRLRDIPGAGEVIDAAVEAGANELQSFELAMAEPEALRAEARLAAVRDARDKAEAMAEAADAEIGDVLMIDETGGSGPGPRRMGARLTADAVRMEAAPVEAGEQEIRVRVTARFELDD